MIETHNNENFVKYQTKFNSTLNKIRLLIMSIDGDSQSTLNLNLNQLLRVLFYNLLEYEFNYPKSDSIVMLQSRFNLSFQDAQRFSASRYMFFKINLISILYFTLEQYSNNLLTISNLYDQLKEKNFRNKYSLLLSESQVSDFKNKNDMITVFKFLRSSFHKGGIYNGDNKIYTFGNITYDFVNDQSPELGTEELFFLFDNIVDIIVEITKSKKFKKFFKNSV